MHLAGHHLGAASLEATGDTMGPPIEVATDTLDACLAGLDRTGPVAFIKCDVEHRELSVFEGGERTLRKDRPILLFESGNLVDGHRFFRPVFAFLESLGYRGYFFSGRALVPLNRFNVRDFDAPKDENQNFVFLHDERMHVDERVASLVTS